MNIVHQSADRLALEHRPMAWMVGLGVMAAVLLIAAISALADGALGGAAVAGALLGAIGWVALTRVFRRVALVADRSTGVVGITTTTLLGEQAETHALADLLRAEVESRYRTTDSTVEPGLVLVLDRGDRPERLRLDLFRPDPADLLQAEQQINGWLGHVAARAAAGQTRSTSGESIP